MHVCVCYIRYIKFLKIMGITLCTKSSSFQNGGTISGKIPFKKNPDSVYHHNWSTKACR